LFEVDETDIPHTFINEGIIAVGRGDSWFQALELLGKLNQTSFFVPHLTEIGAFSEDYFDSLQGRDISNNSYM
jgi:hypothetical protein